MSQSLALVLVHIIFSTKYRIAFLQSPELRSEVHAYLTGTLRGLHCEPLQVGGMPDHFHILSGLSRTTSLAELVKHLKTSSTMAIKAKGHSHLGLSLLANQPRNRSWHTSPAKKSITER
jgi:putative transposase